MEEEMVPAEDAYRSFVDYFKEYENQIDKLTLKRIYNSASHIAESVHKINLTEHKYLNRLKKLMAV
jgi:hypothetical protein